MKREKHDDICAARERIRLGGASGWDHLVDAARCQEWRNSKGLSLPELKLDTGQPETAHAREE